MKTGINDLERENGSFGRGDEDKADVLNTFFANVFTREHTNNIPEPVWKGIREVLEDIDITEEEVLNKIMKLNPSKSQGQTVFTQEC